LSALQFFPPLINSQVIQVIEWIRLLFFTNYLFLFVQIMAHLSSRESSKPQSPQKAYLLGELADTKSLAQKEEEMSQLVERLQRLEEAQERQIEKGDGNREELLEATHTMGVEKKTKIDDCITLKRGTINTHHQSLHFLLLNYLVLVGKVIIMCI